MFHNWLEICGSGESSNHKITKRAHSTFKIQLNQSFLCGPYHDDEHCVGHVMHLPPDNTCEINGQYEYPLEEPGLNTDRSRDLSNTVNPQRSKEYSILSLQNRNIARVSG